MVSSLEKDYIFHVLAIDGTLTVTTSQSQSGLESNHNEGVLHIS